MLEFFPTLSFVCSEKEEGEKGTQRIMSAFLLSFSPKIIFIQPTCFPDMVSFASVTDLWAGDKNYVESLRET